MVIKEQGVMNVKLLVVLPWVIFSIVQRVNMICVKIAVKIMINMEKKFRQIAKMLKVIYLNYVQKILMEEEQDVMNVKRTIA